MTPNQTKETILDKKQFEAFLLIYAAHIDYEFSDSEKVFILERTDPKTYEEMYAYFLDRGDYACMKILLKHKRIYYDTESELDRIFTLLKSLFEVDGEYSRIEKSFVDFFKKMIDTEWI